MTLNLNIIRRIIWPERASLFVIIGGAIGLAGDITSFFSEFVSPYWLLAISALLAAISALLCFQRAMLVDAANTEAVEEVIQCRVCDTLRFSLFAVAAFIMLLAIGQGQSATETIGENIGLIQKDIADINEGIGRVSDNVEAVRQDVGDISEIMESQKITPNPETPAEYFGNAWKYAHIQRDINRAFEMAQGIYSSGAPRKLDAAELYFNTGRQVKGRSELLAEMEALGHARNDSALLVVAARNASSEEERQRLYAEARKMDPEQPFAYWDVQAQTAGRIAPEEQAAATRSQIEGIERFLKHYSQHPASHYFFLPQYQADFDGLARQTLSNLKSTLETYERMEKMRENTQKLRNDAKQQLESLQYKAPEK